MTVAQLIEFLKTQPQDLPVAYEIHSEYCMLEEEDIVIGDHCLPREDGWIERQRSDKKTQTYLVFPGN
jgi:hypothetical protein